VRGRKEGAGETLWALAREQQDQFQKKRSSLATFARSLIGVANNDQVRQQIAQRSIDHHG
jgi:hypothetical protein